LLSYLCSLSFSLFSYWWIFFLLSSACFDFHFFLIFCIFCLVLSINFHPSNQELCMTKRNEKEDIWSFRWINRLLMSLFRQLIFSSMPFWTEHFFILFLLLFILDPLLPSLLFLSFVLSLFCIL
jgi:uncharacterized membrane protein